MSSFSLGQAGLSGLSGSIIYSIVGGCSQEEQESLRRLKESLKQHLKIIKMKIEELDDVLVEEKIDIVLAQLTFDPSELAVRAVLSCKLFLRKLNQFYFAITERNSIWKTLGKCPSNPHLLSPSNPHHFSSRKAVS